MTKTKSHPITLFILTILFLMLTLAVTITRATAGPMAAEAIGATTRVSIASDGTEGNGWSGVPSISADGRYVAFASTASNLVPGDTNDAADVFVHDRAMGETSRVSIASGGTEGNASSESPGISGDGRYVAFSSTASNLVPGDTNETYDVFVHDRTMGETTRISVASDGTENNSASDNPSISADGRHVAFESQASIFVHDRVTGETTRVSVASDGTPGNDDAYGATISGDGRYVAFHSDASNLVSGDTNGDTDIFVHDRIAGETTRVSVASDGAQGNSYSTSPSISGDGRYVAFESYASNLVPGDTNSCYDAPIEIGPYNCLDVFVHDRATGETIRVSVASDGAEANDDSDAASISGDGRYVAFRSWANNLVPGDTVARDLFVHDRVTGETTRVSVASGGAQSNSHAWSGDISGNGRYVAFESWANNLVLGDTNDAGDVFVHDRTPEHGVALSEYATHSGAPGTMVMHTVTLHNVAVQADSFDLALSGGFWPAVIDGPATVALAAGASSEVAVVVSVPGDAQLGSGDTVMLSATSHGSPILSVTADLTTVATRGATERVSVTSGGVQGDDASWGPSISGDGRYVAFESPATNFAPGDETNEWCGGALGGPCGDIFVHDRMTGETTIVSLNSDGSARDATSYSPSISGDGRHVAFISWDSNWHVFVHDRTTGETTLASVSSDGTPGNAYSGIPTISGDGRFVAFRSESSNLVPGDTNGSGDVFVHDRATGETTLVSVSSDGAQGNASSGYSASISRDGRFVAFDSSASNLVPGDTNGAPDVFVHDRATGDTMLVSVASGGAQGDDDSGSPTVSGDGRYVAFSSRAGNLVPGDTNHCSDDDYDDSGHCYDVFVHDRTTGETIRVSVASDNAQGNDGSYAPSISGSGRYVAFTSYASNLVPGDTNGAPDVFVHDRATGETIRVSFASDGLQGAEANSHSDSVSISGSGRYVAFGSLASNLVPGDVNDASDVFVRDRYFGLPPSSYLPFVARP